MGKALSQVNLVHLKMTRAWKSILQTTRLLPASCQWWIISCWTINLHYMYSATHSLLQIWGKQQGNYISRATLEIYLSPRLQPTKDFAKKFVICCRRWPIFCPCPVLSRSMMSAMTGTTLLCIVPSRGTLIWCLNPTQVDCMSKTQKTLMVMGVTTSFRQCKKTCRCSPSVRL